MFPIIPYTQFLNGHSLHTYGLLVAIAFLAGIQWVSYESRRVGENTQRLTDLCFYIIVSAIAGSRVFYLMAEQPGWWYQPLDFFKVWEGGLTFYGGVIGATLFSVWYLIHHHFNFWKVADIFMPGVALGHVFGRLGCLAAGCCYGRPVPDGSSWGIVFPPHPENLAPPGIPLYPTQLMEAAAELVIFLILVLFRKKKKFDGQVMLLYLILYPSARIVVELFRGELARDMIGISDLSAAQVVSLCMIAFAIVTWVIKFRSSHQQKVQGH